MSHISTVGTEVFQLHRRLDELNLKIDVLLKAHEAEQTALWVDKKTACSILGISDRHMFELIARGTIHGDSVKNVGTVKRTRYRFHRTRILDQYLKAI